MRFDWYQATIQAHPVEIAEVLRSAYGAEVHRTRGMHGYTQGFDIVTANGTAAKILAGGINQHPNAWASGEDTDTFVDVVRGTWPDDHTVSRMDAAEDFTGAGSWDKLNSTCLDVADSLKLKVSQAGDYHRLEDGRTLYVGSRKSPVFLRLYEKGKQLRAKVTHGAEDISADWCRLEAQIRPQKLSKKAAAYSTPEQAWGFSAWTQTLANRILDLDVPRVQMHVWREPDDQRAFDFMIRQYGPMLNRLCQDLGDWKVVGMQIGDAISRRNNAR